MFDDDNRRDCRSCDGVGTLSPDALDLWSIEEMREFLLSLATPERLGGSDRNDRLNTLARITMVAGRLAWLETAEAHTEAIRERFNIPAVAK
jgi:hypothetical protein